MTITAEEFDALLEEMFEEGYNDALRDLNESVDPELYEKRKRLRTDMLKKAARNIMYKDPEKYQGVIGFVDWISDSIILSGVTSVVAYNIINSILKYMTDNMATLTLDDIENVRNGIISAGGSAIALRKVYRQFIENQEKIDAEDKKK